ncbi:GTP pyrophosphokinase family protein [Oceanicaulis sp. LC35]|uniref:GTP pyrophosphokinase n=1 Tax=Oceanicaulis sp. LC35 TaxID=3349635 RepID=UPI003F85576F
MSTIEKRKKLEHFADMTDSTRFKERFRNQYSEKNYTLKTACKIIRDLIFVIVRDSDIEFSKVTYRIKEAESCLDKYERKYRSNVNSADELFEAITDIMGVRIVLLYEDDIPKIKKLLQEDFEILGTTDKSSAIEEIENQFGYKGLHLDLKMKGIRTELQEYKIAKDAKFELQIRSIVQDAWSEVDHKLKYKSEIPTKLKRRISRLAALFELADQEFINIRDDVSDLESSTINTDPEYLSQDFESKKLDVFSFIKLSSPHFPDQEFRQKGSDSFVRDIRSCNKDITSSDFEQALNSLEVISNYQRDIEKEFKPFNSIRHALYLNSKKHYAPLLYDHARKNFDTWLAERKKSK